MSFINKKRQAIFTLSVLFIYRSLLKISFLCVFVFGQFHLEAQDEVASTYRSILNNFSSKKQLGYQVDYYFYETLTAQEPSHQLSMKIRKTPDRSYASFEEMEIIQEKDKMIFIDHTGKHIQMRQDVPANLPLMEIGNFVELINYLDLKGNVFEPGDGKKGIQLLGSGTSKMKIELIYEPKDTLIEQLDIAFDLTHKEELYYEFDQKRIIVKFSNYQLEQIKLPLALHQIIQWQGKKPIGKGKFKNYSIAQ